MNKLNYDKSKLQNEDYYQSKIYKVNSLYKHKDLHAIFLQLKANVVDLNPALITKCIQGTEQDFIMLMNKAKDFLHSYKNINEQGKEILLDLFRDCVFGYYVLTPLIKAKDVSDIKVLNWNQITCKANGDRYLTNLSFENEDDYNRWFDRILRIHRLQRFDEAALQHCKA